MTVATVAYGEVAEAAEIEEERRERTLASRIAGIARAIEKLSRGERAELSRLRQDSMRIPPEVFWRLVDQFEIHQLDEPFWMSVLPLMVTYPHTPGERPGHVLESAGVSAARVERWLRLDKQGAWREADRLLSATKAKAVAGVDWVSFGHLLYRWDEKHRNNFARDFFVTRSRRAAQSTTEGGE
jgi:CRISPR type I-E-associated protein CasB/Cse2